MSQSALGGDWISGGRRQTVVFCQTAPERAPKLSSHIGSHIYASDLESDLGLDIRLDLGSDLDLDPARLSFIRPPMIFKPWIYVIRC